MKDHNVLKRIKAVLNTIVLLPFVFCNCSTKQPSRDKLFIPEFKWQIKIPAFLASQNMEEWKRVQDAGRRAIGSAYNIDIKKVVHTVFIFKSNDDSYFEAVSEPISKDQADNYLETCERMNNIVYNTIRTQVPSARIDTVKGVEFIDKLPFQYLKINLTFPGGQSKTTISYRRVFEENELTVSIMYADQGSGNKILWAFENSNFATE